MKRMDLILSLNELLLSEMEGYREEARSFGADMAAQRRLLRSLMNLRPPAPLGAELLRLQDSLLALEREERGVIDPFALPRVADGRIALWRGDITRLAVDAIVNAANDALLGCFHPCHGCVDNAIHSAAGLQLREECAAIMAKQGHPEETGTVKATRAYNLPCRFVFHTVGPIVSGPLAPRHRAQLRACYTACLELAEGMGLASIAFCCVSTGEFRFPPEDAAAIAIEATRERLTRPSSIDRIVFALFTERDLAIYLRLLREEDRRDPA